MKSIKKIIFSYTRKHLGRLHTHIEKNLLAYSIAVPAILIILNIIIGITCPNLRQDLKNIIGLSFYQVILFIGAILTILWTNKRHKQGERRYKQAEESIFLNKINSTYLDLVKAMGSKDTKDGSSITNLINSIQASISNHYTEEDKRKEMRSTILNFSFMNLSGVNFEGANLSEANLRNANLTKAVLTKANLTKADLREADLIEADLREANLNEADLREANLSKAKLIKAVLHGADLTQADLTQANLTQDKWIKASLTWSTVREEADLKQVKSWKNAKITTNDLKKAGLTKEDVPDAIIINPKTQKIEI